MKSNYVKKAAQESLQRIEKQYGPERAAKVKAARKAYGEYLFSVIGYCERCGSPILQADHHILREDYHLCSDCFTVLMDEAYEGQAEGTSALTIIISIRRAVDGIEELTTTRDVKDWDFYVLDLGIEESKEQLSLQHKMEALRKQLAGEQAAASSNYGNVNKAKKEHMRHIEAGDEQDFALLWRTIALTTIMTGTGAQDF